MKMKQFLWAGLINLLVLIFTSGSPAAQTTRGSLFGVKKVNLGIFNK
jgi:hypothetical protein